MIGVQSLYGLPVFEKDKLKIVTSKLNTRCGA